MKCCSKAFVGLAVLAGLGVAIIAATGVGPAVWHRAVAKFEKQIPPEVQIDQLKIDIAKLDKDIDKNWGPIATYEREIKELKADLAKKSDKSKSMEKELAAAADEYEAKAKFVRLEGKEYPRSEAGKVLSRQVDFFTALKREVASKEKLLSARETKLNAAMAMQKEMMSQKEELKTQVAQLEADLEVLKLRQTEAKLPIEKSNRLDKIKERLNKLQTEVQDKSRAEELRESFNGNNSAAPVDPKEKVNFDDDLVRRIRGAVKTDNNVAKDDE
jgi:DNA repair exonuclease SbcCD ATPase subunit